MRAPLALAVAGVLAGGCGGSKAPVEDTAEAAVMDPTADVVTSAPHFVIVVQGTYAWMGSDTYAAADEEPITGAYEGVVRALDAAGNWQPAETVALVIAIGDEPNGRQLYGGTVGNLNGSVLGDQKAYANDIAVGLQTALHAIEKKLSSEDGRKIMVIIGDGTDVVEAFDAQAAADRLRKAGFEVFTIHYASALGEVGDGPGNAKTLGFSGHRSAQSRDEIAGHLTAIYREAFAEKPTP